MIGLWAAMRRLKFTGREPVRADWALRQHYQSMFGAGTAIRAIFLGVELRPFSQ